jgi:DNA-binding GntR family transcriptional regulator
VTAREEPEARVLVRGSGGGARIADWVYDSIRQGILEGQLPPGHRLRQNEVAGEFRVSHTPVREALARLASEGLVTLRPRRGAEVNSIDLSDVADIYAIRQLLEPAALALSMERSALVPTEALGAAQPPSGRRSALELFDHNRRFHRLLSSGCGNKRMISTLESLWDSVTAARMFEAYASNEAEIARSNAEHLAIATAIADSDTREAVRLLEAHLGSARNDLLELVKHMEPEHE